MTRGKRDEAVEPLTRVSRASAARGGRGERAGSTTATRAQGNETTSPARRPRQAREVGAGYQRAARLRRLRGIPLVHRRDTQSIPAGADRRSRWPVWHRRAGPWIRVARASLRGCPCPCAAAMGPPAHFTRFERPSGTARAQRPAEMRSSPDGDDSPFARACSHNFDVKRGTHARNHGLQRHRHRGGSRSAPDWRLS